MNRNSNIVFKSSSSIFFKKLFITPNPFSDKGTYFISICLKIHLNKVDFKKLSILFSSKTFDPVITELDSIFFRIFN